MIFILLHATGEPGLSGAGDHQSQHDRALPAHLRRGPAADLHAHAPRLLPALRQLAHLQGPAQDVRGGGLFANDVAGGRPRRGRVAAGVRRSRRVVVVAAAALGRPSTGRRSLPAIGGAAAAADDDDDGVRGRRSRRPNADLKADKIAQETTTTILPK